MYVLPYKFVCFTEQWVEGFPSSCFRGRVTADHEDRYHLIKKKWNFMKMVSEFVSEFEAPTEFGKKLIADQKLRWFGHLQHMDANGWPRGRSRKT